MSAGASHKDGVWTKYYGPNLGYIQDQYEQYALDPESVEPAYRELFSKFGPPPSFVASSMASTGSVHPAKEGGIDKNLLPKVVNATKLVENIRRHGHLIADIDPIGINEKPDTRLLEPETYQLTKEDLQSIPAQLIWENAPEHIENGWDAIQHLLQTYTRSIAYEFSHVINEEEREWLNRYAETSEWPISLNKEERQTLLKRLAEVENFETFLHRTFAGQKRFSIEGNDSLVPMLDEIVRMAAGDGTEHVLMGMAHRGRLNVLAHVLGKAYSQIFSEFHHAPLKDNEQTEADSGWTGDVKYHLGASRTVKYNDRAQTKVTLANNPSHLEYVNPVVEGFARAAQEDRTKAGFPKQDTKKAVAVIMHGDAAFPGEGIVTETLNFNKLRGYHNGGTVHIIVNNRLGFTTDSVDSRSTRYSSDLAKGYEIPVIHVNADDPEACIAAARMAYEYRRRFKKDFLIDLIGYRRHGHNEMDDPEATQPIVYSKVRSHPTVYTLYGEKLKGEGVVDETTIKEINAEVGAKLKKAYEEMKEAQNAQQQNGTNARSLDLSQIQTSVDIDLLREINENLLKVPDGFKVYPKLQRILQRRAKSLDGGNEKVDWALGEALAFATILSDGTPIRITGQDSERGTFAHRHLMLHDHNTGETYSPLHALPQAKASFAIHNSPLSEASVLGFEYGYNVFAPETLVFWEAQFGDFVNVAQVIIDQFISAAKAKWRQKSNLIMLLPHGYEGQGPEHSSARLERFLQLSAEDNWTVANVTSSAQYFHILRRQAALSGTESARPLIMMSPKSLIRNPRAASTGSEFSEGSFQTVVQEPLLGSKPEKVERVILCSGKVALDLQAKIEEDDPSAYEWLHILRVEQLYPFPEQEIATILKSFKNVRELVWVQEEPKNMGAWSFMEPRLRKIAPKKASVSYIGRPERSSTASGFSDVHNMEQQQMISAALKNHSLITNS